MRYVSSATYCAICLVTIFSFTACSEDTYDHATSSDVLQFAVSVNDTKNISADELAKESKVAGEAKRIDGITDSVFICPLYEPTFRGGVAQQSRKSQNEGTRGTQLSSNSEMTLFGVTGYQGTDQLFSNIKAIKSSSSNFMLNTSEELPSDGGTNITYYAYQPYGNSAVIYDGATTIKYTVPSSNADQPDILYAKNTSSASDKRVALTFDHALTAVKLVVGSDLLNGTIKRITLKNVYGYGEFNLTTSTWNNQSSLSSFSVTGAKAVSSGAVLTANGEYFMMVPQTLPSDAAIEIEYSDAFTPNKVLSKTIGGTWSPGTTVTYLLSSSAIKVLNITSITFPQTIGTGSSTATYPAKSAYTSGTSSTGDAFGMYITKNNSILSANVKVTNINGKWTPASTIVNRPGYVYYIYYPYQSSLASAPTIVTSGTTSSSFFNNVIKSWVVDTDQSTASNMNKSDLQIASANATATTGAIQFAPTHAIGMGVIKQNSVEVYDQYHLKGDNTYTFQGDPQYVYSSTSFTNNKPMLKNNDSYFLCSPNKITTISASKNLPTKTADGTNEWTVSFSANSNECKIFTATKPTSTYYTDQEYILQVGDIYYSDGAISRPGSTAEFIVGKKSLGVVAYVGKDAWTNNGHAIVICKYTLGAPTNNALNHGTSYSTLAAAQAGLASFVSQNTLPTPSASSGWFIPSTNQSKVIYKELNNGVMPESHPWYPSFITLSQTIDNSLKSLGSYTQYLSLKTNYVEWVSDFNGQDYFELRSDGAVGWGSGVYQGLVYSRPFLTF